MPRASTEVAIKLNSTSRTKALARMMEDADVAINAASYRFPEMLKALTRAGFPNRLASQSGRKDRLRQPEPEREVLSQGQQPQRPLTAAFGLMPLVVPYEDSLPELRILNAVSAGLLFEGSNSNFDELVMTKSELARTLRSLRTSGAIHIDPSGRYRLAFNTSNFPNVASR